MLKQSNKNLIALYATHRSVWKVGKILGMTGQSVHSLLKKYGVDTSARHTFTLEQVEELKDIYKSLKVGDGQLDKYCLKHNKLKSNVSRKARELGLTLRRREEYDANFKKEISKRRKEEIARLGHPRGFSGGKHTDRAKQAIGAKAKAMWNNHKHKVNTVEYREKLSNRALNQYLNGHSELGYSRAKRGTYNINGKSIYFRSLWEANYALYLDFLVKNNKIKSWKFEPKTFWFDSIKRGVRSYKPDFEVVNLNGSIEYHETKGWMDNKSKTKIKRMAKYYPDTKLILIQQPEYKAILNQLSGLIKFY